MTSRVAPIAAPSADAHRHAWASQAWHTEARHRNRDREGADSWPLRYQPSARGQSGRRALVGNVGSGACGQPPRSGPLPFGRGSVRRLGSVVVGCAFPVGSRDAEPARNSFGPRRDDRNGSSLRKLRRYRSDPGEWARFGTLRERWLPNPPHVCRGTGDPSGRITDKFGSKRGALWGWWEGRWRGAPSEALARTDVPESSVSLCLTCRSPDDRTKKPRPAECRGC